MKTNSILVGGRKNAYPDEIILLKGNANYTNLYLLDGKKFTFA